MMLCTWTNGLDGFQATVRMPSPGGKVLRKDILIVLRSLIKGLRRQHRIVTRPTRSIWTFDDLVVGDEWETARRTVTETDVVLFAGLSGDFNPLHVDHFSSRSGPFGRPVAHGLLGMSIATGLVSQTARIDTMALLAILEWRFLLPIAFGDTIHVVSTVESLEAHASGRRGVVTWRRQVLNQDRLVVQEGRTQTLVRARSPAESPSSIETDNAS
jgi:3-hydroxybutyryl-CoA dehydratase